jgi:hypothetical protein
MPPSAMGDLRGFAFVEIMASSPPPRHFPVKVEGDCDCLFMQVNANRVKSLH